MDRRKITPKQAQEAFAAWKEHGEYKAAAKALGIGPNTAKRRALKWQEMQDAVTPVEEDDPSEVRRLEAQLKELKKELRTARKEQITNDEVKRFILGSKANTEEIPEWLDKKHGGIGGVDVPTTIWSDFHYAEVVEPDEVMGLNKYDPKIAADRLNTLCCNTRFLTERHLQPKKWPGIVINLGGDMLSGDIHPELTETNAEQMMPAFVGLRRELAKALTFMADHYGKVFVPCVWGNHTRTTKKVPMKRAAYRNFDWLLYHELADMLAKDERIRFAIADGVELQYKILGHRYRLTHGHQFRGGQGFVGPLAPITRGEIKKRIAAESQGHAYDTLLIGHFHQCLWRKRVIVNGSLVGYNEMAQACGFEYDYPKQWLWLTNQHLGPVSPMEVHCEDIQQNPASDGWVSWRED